MSCRPMRVGLRSASRGSAWNSRRERVALGIGGQQLGKPPVKIGMIGGFQRGETAGLFRGVEVAREPRTRPSARTSPSRSGPRLRHRAAQLRREPRVREAQLALHGGERHAERRGGLFERQAAEIALLDDLALARDRAPRAAPALDSDPQRHRPGRQRPRALRRPRPVAHRHRASPHAALVPDRRGGAASPARPSPENACGLRTATRRTSTSFRYASWTSAVVFSDGRAASRRSRPWATRRSSSYMSGTRRSSASRSPSLH